MKKMQFYLAVCLVLCLGFFMSCDQVNEKKIKDVTTIDSMMQEEVRSILTASMKDTKCDWGCVIVMNSFTGEVKSLVNLSMDTSSSTFSENFDFATFKLIEPGRLFSLAALMAGIEDNYFLPDDTVDCGKGKVNLFGKEIIDTIKGGYGTITVAESFIKGSEIGTVRKICNAYYTDQNSFINTIKKFRLDQILGIDSVEPAPHFNSPESGSWTETSLQMCALGNECKMTPFQILGFFNTIALKGKRIRPVLSVNDTIKLPLVLDEKLYRDKTINGAEKLIGENNTVVSSSNINSENSSVKTEIACSFLSKSSPSYTVIVVVNNNSEGFNDISIKAHENIIGYLKSVPENKSK